MSPSATETGHAVTNERISPKELTALVARLHERDEAMTTADVAGALGMNEGDVAAALAEVRRSRAAILPPIVKAPKRTGRPPALALALIAGALGFVAVVVRVPGLRSSLPASYTRSAMTPGDALRATLPLGMKVTVGEMEFNGRGHPAVTEAEVRRLLTTIVDDAKGPVTGGTVDVAQVRRALNYDGDTPTEGVTFLPVTVTGKNGVTFTTHVPIASADVEEASEDLDTECRDAASSRVAAAANHIADYSRL